MKYKGILIYPPTQLMQNELPKPDGSLGLLYLAAALEKNGIPTDILDANIGDGRNLEDTLFRVVPQENNLIKIGMNFEEIANYVKNGNYTFVGITSNFTSQTRMVIETAKLIKNSNKDIKIFVGGINARVMKEFLLNTGYFDGVCLTDGEIIFPRVILEGIKNIPGWSYLDNMKIITNDVDITCFPKHLDDLPMPAWEKLPLRQDMREVNNHKNELFASIMTSRGCPNNCTYCHISGSKKDVGKLRLHSLNRVVAEIKRLKELGIHRIYIEDSSFLAIKSRVKKLFELLKNEKELTFLGIVGVNLINLFNRKKEINGQYPIDIDFIQMLYNNNYRRIAFPVESGSQRIIDKYCSGKINLNKMNLIKLMEVLTNIGIETTVHIMIGFPDETEEEIQKSIEIAKKLKEVGSFNTTVFFATPFPGSELYNICIKEGYLDENLNPDIFNWRNPIMKNTIVSIKKLIEIQKQANIDLNNLDFIHEMESKNINSLLKQKGNKYE